MTTAREKKNRQCWNIGEMKQGMIFQEKKMEEARMSYLVSKLLNVLKDENLTIDEAKGILNCADTMLGKARFTGEMGLSIDLIFE